MLATTLPTPSVPCGNQPRCIKRLSTRVYAASSTAERSNHCRPVASSSTATYERILRYPDGKERRIIYPRADPTDPCEETCDTCFDETWEADHPWDIPGAHGSEENVVGSTGITTPDPTHPPKARCGDADDEGGCTKHKTLDAFATTSGVTAAYLATCTLAVLAIG